MDPTPTELAAIDSIASLFAWIGIEDKQFVAAVVPIAFSLMFLQHLLDEAV